MFNIRKKIFAYLFIFLGLIGFMDFALLYRFGVVMNFGNVLPGIVGVLLIVSGFLQLRGINILAFKSVWLRKIIYSIMGLLILSFVVIEGLIIASIHTDNKSNVDYVIILGAGLKGEQMTITFQNRVDKGLDFLQKNPALKVIVSGGKGYAERISEAEAMKRYLVKNGIPENRIIMEDRSTNTAENFKFSRELISSAEHQGKPGILIVTSEFHMLRAKMLASRNGFIPYGLPAQTWPGVLPNCFIREYFAIIKSFIVDR
jgi:uncharacterized SAM-binding protein YcdF (DUF218 family)